MIRNRRWTWLGDTMATGQLFSRTTQALFYNYKQLPIQRMLDFDFLCGVYRFFGYFFFSVLKLDLNCLCLEMDVLVVTEVLMQGGKHRLLLESSIPVLRDFRSSFSVRRRSLSQCTQNMWPLLRLICGFADLDDVLRLSDLDNDYCCSIEASCAAHPTADVFINFASYRR